MASMVKNFFKTTSLEKIWRSERLTARIDFHGSLRQRIRGVSCAYLLLYLAYIFWHFCSNADSLVFFMWNYAHPPTRFLEQIKFFELITLFDDSQLYFMQFWWCVGALGFLVSLRRSLGSHIAWWAVSLLGSGFLLTRLAAVVGASPVVEFTTKLPASVGLDVQFWGLFALAAVLVVAFLVHELSTTFYSTARRIFLQNRALDQVVLTTLAVVFAGVLLAASNLLMVFLAWVGLNLALYGLLAQFSFSLKAQEAAIKYFVLGIISAGFFIFGLWLLYLSYGSLAFNVLAASMFQSTLHGFPVLAILGAALILFVFLFKLSAFPFQFWALDVYEGSSWYALSLLILLVKPVFILALTKTMLVFSGLGFFLTPILFVSGVGSLVVGTIGAAFQSKIKRFLAMSSISHVGFMLILISMDYTNTTLTYNYLVSYVLANAILVFVLSNARISGPTYTTRRAIVYWSELAYLNGSGLMRSGYTMVLVFALLSLAGLPPFMGFFVKLGFFLACASKLTIASVFAAFIGFILMPISVFNYLRLVRLLWAGDCSPAAQPTFLVSVAHRYWFAEVIFFIAGCVVAGGALVV